MRFEFATAARIVFGEGVIKEAAPAAATMGTRALVVTGASPERAAPLIASLEKAGLVCVPFAAPVEPTVDMVREGAAYACESLCDVVISMGGGSAIDAGKALAALLANPGDPLDYLEVIGRGQPLTRPSVPFIAIPTTAGTGSEVTRNAVLASPAHRVKASLRSAGMLARLAVVDPELTAGLPRAITASTGMDALTQLIEPYTSSRANPMTDQFCVEGLRHAADALPRVWDDGSDREARSAMSWTSLLGGLALANAGLGAVHGFAAAIGGMWPAPHGSVCAALLPHAMEINVEALQSRAPDHIALRRYREIASLLTGRLNATALDGANWVAGLCSRFEIPPLRTYGVTAADLDNLVAKAAQTSSMKGNPIVLTALELHEIAKRSL